jgi:trans-aconitate 2-methyltransferase
VKGTSLTRFERLLPPDLYARFVDEYRTRLLAAIGDTAPYFYPFRRILLWGRKPR